MKRSVPWLLGLVPAAAWVVALLRCVTAPVGDADVWWVAAAGRRMLATGSVPRTNAFSFVEPDRPWVMHEWLFGPPYALGLRALGPAFLAIVASVAFIALAGVVASATVARAKHAAVGCLLAAVPLVLLAHPTARPTWVALVFPAAMAALAFRERLGGVAVVAAVVLELLWTNTHGTFPLGVVLLAASALAFTADRRRRALASVAAALATLANPYGLRLHALAAQYAFGWGSGGDDLRRILEYAPVWDGRYFATVSPVAAVALVFLVALSVDALARGPHRARAALVLALVPFAVLHARNAPLLGVVAAVVLVPVADDLVERLRLAPFAGDALRVRPAAALAALGAVLAAAAASLATASRRDDAAWMDASLGGASFVRLAARIPDGGRAMAPFRSSGLLLWLAADRGVRVLYDSRNDSYSPAMRHLGLTLPELPPAAIAAELEARGTDLALVPSPAGVPDSIRVGYDGALANAAGWSCASRDGGWCLYRRAP